MKYINLWVVTAIVMLSTLARANEEYVTGCFFKIEGDRTGYKYRTVEDENITSFTSTEDITPAECVSKAVSALKQKHTTRFLAGGHFQTTTYRNKVATIHIVHKDNVAFPKQQLELSVACDAELSLQNGFAFVESWFDDNYYEARISAIK